MSSTEFWLNVKVSLLSGRAEAFDPPPGRVLLVSPAHTLADLAEAIDVAFGRWDRSHLHMFELPDGRTAISGELDDEGDGEVSTETIALGSLRLNTGDRLRYVFDLGDGWMHECEVVDESSDPLEEYGVGPDRPVPIDGWGWLPDQYGRESELDDD